MQQRFLSHMCCCGSEIYNKHIVTLGENHTLLALQPYSEETAHTMFADGFIIVVDTTFEQERESFTKLIQEELHTQPDITLKQALLQNPVYNKHSACIGQPCSVYSIVPISWHTLRPLDTSRLLMKRII